MTSFLVLIIDGAFWLFFIAILGRIILSFVIPMMEGRPNPLLLTIYQVFGQITEPILGPLRRILPTFGRFDFSPLVAIIILQVVHNFLINRLSQ